MDGIVLAMAMLAGLQAVEIPRVAPSATRTAPDDPAGSAVLGVGVVGGGVAHGVEELVQQDPAESGLQAVEARLEPDFAATIGLPHPVA